MTEVDEALRRTRADQLAQLRDTINAFERMLAEAMVKNHGYTRVLAGDYARTIRNNAELFALEAPLPTRVDCSHCGAEDVGRVYTDRCAMCGCHFSPWRGGFRAWAGAHEPLADTYQLMRAQACTLLGDLDRMAKIVAASKLIGVVK